MGGPGDDFDESTPPPRSRPEGEPLPRLVTLPPGEPLLPWFAQCDRAGRVPVGCVLLRHVGTCYGLAGHAGYVVLAGDGLGAVGSHPTLEAMGRFRDVCAVREGGERRMPDVVVVAPAG
jgi:hypothetical protein